MSQLSPESVEDIARALNKILFLLRNGRINALALISLDDRDHITQIMIGAADATVPLIGAIELMKRDVMEHADVLCPCHDNPGFHDE